MDLLALLDCKAVCVGLKDLALPADNWMTLLKQSHIPVLCTNAYIDKPRAAFAPYSEISSGMYLMSVLGDNGAANASIQTDVIIEDPYTSIIKCHDLLGETQNVIVLASGIGFEELERIAELEFVSHVIVTDCGPYRSEKIHAVPYPDNSTILLLDGLGKEPYPRISTNRVIVDSKYPEDSKALKMIDVVERKWAAQFANTFDQEKLAEMNKVDKSGLSRRSKLSSGISYYVGSETCAVCHKSEYDKWKTTSHAKSLQSLRDAGSADRVLCLQCHVTGLGASSGYSPTEPHAEKSLVGCECCHGPRSRHIEYIAQEATSVSSAKQAPLDKCFACHDSEHSPGFDAQASWEHIKH
jgi:hypothetical protein